MRGRDEPSVLCQLLATLAIVLPWINPFASGPSPSVLPWLVSAACAAVACLLAFSCRLPWQPLIGRGWLVAGLLSAVFGVLQYVGASAWLGGWVNITEAGLAYGNLRQRNQFATLMNISLLALVWMAMSQAGSTGPRGDAPPARPALLLAAAALLGLGNAASASRTGMIELALVLGLALVWQWWRSVLARRALLAALGAYTLGAVLLPRLAGLDPNAVGILSRLGEDGASCESRLVLWRNVLYLIELSPWSGWGWRELDHAHFMTLYPGPRFCDILDNAHNLPLHLAVELGVPAALLACAVLGGMVLRAQPWRETDECRRMAWAVLALIGLHSLLEYPLWYGPFQMAVALAVWMLWRTPGSATRGAVPDASIPQMSAPAWVAGCAAVALLALVYAGWDYRRVSQIYKEPGQRAAAYRSDTLAKVQDSWLFRNQVRFAALTLSSVTPANALAINRSARELLHFSPEARVVEKLIDSALVLRRTDEARFFMQRFRIAYPKDYARWRETRAPLAELPAIDP